ncbi:hypothetical protein [Prosthecobacter dejongeii]|uniref:Uncharacterized protein n=1 Tax=Prosthecobacter dejongeii TaxID=48465 RepID=A0A7W7YHA8_9BACT|nr:hypothetical protein [Prosthecobacter dejongeii]MBB5036163.1 hypothetical protein [Prosthecobacter dejongeii]
MAAHFNPPVLSPSLQQVESLVISSKSGSTDEEKRFRIDALQIVTTCEQALQSPRMLIDSVLAEADGKLGGLRVNYRSFLGMEKYDKVEGYLMCLINSVKHVQNTDSSTSHQSDDLLVGLIDKGNRMIRMDQAMRMPTAYIHDLKIILGAGYGDIGEVDRMLRNLSRPPLKRLRNKGSGCLVLLAGMLAFSCCIAFGIVLL